jgi:DeoR/GlpR family transcriptional regulator of sugar metabolism
VKLHQQFLLGVLDMAVTSVTSMLHSAHDEQKCNKWVARRNRRDGNCRDDDASPRAKDGAETAASPRRPRPSQRGVLMTNRGAARSMSNATEEFAAESSSRPAERRRMLLEQVLRTGSAQIDEIAAQFGVSRMTVHRDLDALASQGIVRRVHGGVTVRSSALVESNFLYRSRLAEHEKQAIALAAAELIEPGQAIIIDDSTTAGRLTSFVAARKPLTVITNSVSVVERLSDAHGIETICLGGRFNPRFNAFFGFVCEQAISSLRANTLFMSASTVFGDAAYHQQEDVVKTKRALMGVADKRVLLVDSSKFGVTALIRLAALSDFDVVLTDSGVGPTEAEALRQSGVNLRVADI